MWSLLRIRLDLRGSAWLSRVLSDAMQPQPPSDNATLAALRAYRDEHLSGRVEVKDEDYPIPPELRFDGHGKLRPGEFKKLQDWVTQAKANGHLEEQFTLKQPNGTVTAHGRREEVVQYQTNVFREAIVRALDLAYSESQAREVQAAALHAFGAAMLPPTTPLPAAVAQQTATAAAASPAMESPPTAAGAAAGAGAAVARALATITAAAAAGTVVVVRAAAGYLAGSDDPPAPAAASPARGQTGDPPPTVQQRRIRPAIDRQAADVEDDSDDDGGSGVCGGGGGDDDDDDDNDDADDATEVADPEIDALASSLSRPLVTGPKGVCPEATKLSPYTEKPWSPALTEKRFTGPLYGPTGEPTSDDVHQGALMNCYFCSALTLLAQYTPKVVVDAIKEAKPASGERMFYVRLRTKAGHLVTIEVDDHFYSQPLNLEKFTLGRLKELLSALGQPVVGKTRSDFKQQLESLPDGKRPPTLPIYCQTGDLTTDGCIWPMVLEKAWVALLSAGVVDRKKADKDSAYFLLADKKIVISRGSSEQSEVDSVGAFEIKAPSYENIEGHTAPKNSAVMWNKVDGACLAIGGWDSIRLATSSAGQRDEALGEKEVVELWKHVHHNGKPASLGTRELAKKDDDAAAKDQFSRLQYSHEYAVVGSAILKEDGNTTKLAYLSLGGERVVHDETVAKSLDEDTYANSVFSDEASRTLSGGKYLVLRNPQNRNEEFTKEAAKAQRLNARDYRTRKPRELHRIDSLDKLNKKCFPLKYDDVDEATNIFLLRIDKLGTWSDDISQSSLFSLGTLFTPPTSNTASPSSGGGGTPTKPKKPSSTTPGTSSRGGKSKVATDVAYEAEKAVLDEMLKLSL